MPPLLLLALLVLAGPALAQRPGADLCHTAIAATERTTGVPDRLMQAVAIVESGRRDPSGSVAAWPWTINVEGVGETYDSKQEAIAAVLRHRAAGARSIDVGCMQVNLLAHADAFPSLEDAFDPAANTRWAARFLQQLLGQTGSWPRAVAGYHSLTPDIGADYWRKVLAAWSQPEGGPRLPVPPSPAALSPPAPSAGPMASLPTGAPPRLITTGGGSTPAITGRGLDFYRAMPTRMFGLALRG